MVTIETVGMMQSAPERRKVATTYLPRKCVPLQDSFQIPVDYAKETVTIIIHDNAPVVSLSFDGGDSADSDDPRMFAMNKWTSQLIAASMVECRDKSSCFQGMQLAGDTQEAPSCRRDASDVSPHAATAGFTAVLDAELQKVANAPTNHRPASAYIYVSPEDCSVANKSAGASSSSSAMTTQDKCVRDEKDVIPS